MNNGDLIRREDALLECCRGCRKDSVHGCTVPCPEYMNISNLAAVDAVEVVRCKDCKYRYFNNYYKQYFCELHYGLSNYVDEDDFCCHGKRRSE